MVRRAGSALGIALLFLAHAAAAQFTQQGSKLVGTGAVGAAYQGTSVAISADGTTAIVGGIADNSYFGAAWVYTRSAVVWSQQGDKLVGKGTIGGAQGTIGQGASVAISADGNTAIVGGPYDNTNVGAAWVFTRSGGVWSQQGGKLVGTGAVGGARQGTAVAISADGNTAIVGGPGDNSQYGAAWIFTRSGGVWSQQGGKLVGTGAQAIGTSGPALGTSVAISADGTTAVVGGYGDNFEGAVWVFARAGAVWSQQGDKLINTYDYDQGAGLGWSVAASADGNTIIAGRFLPFASSSGGALVFTRSGGVWAQQGRDLINGVAVGSRGLGLGASVSISADGNLAIVGAPGDYPSGSALVFTRSGKGVWSQQGTKLVGSSGVGAQQGWSVAVSADGSTAIVGGNTDDSYMGAGWVFSATTSGAWVPVVAHNPGLNQSQWRSDLGLLNTSTVTANVQITFYGTGGVAASTTYVPAGTQSILTDVVGQLGASGQGALQVLSDQPLRVTSRTYNQLPSDASCYPNGTQGQDYPVVTAGDGLGAGQSAYLAGLTENASYRCNIGLVNVGPGPATMLVELYSGAGTKLTDYPVNLPAGQWAQQTQPFKNKAGQIPIDRGYAKITVLSGSGVFGFASVVDNLTNDPTTIAMQR